METVTNFVDGNESRLTVGNFTYYFHSSLSVGIIRTMCERDGPLSCL